MQTEYHAPKSLSDLTHTLNQLTPESKILTGGTDLLIPLHKGICRPNKLLYLGEMEELGGITESADHIEIGAMATMIQIAGNKLFAGPYAALRQAAAEVGSVQIRNAATIGGNIANASPAGDLAPVLCLLDAEAVIVGANGAKRNIPIKNMLTGAGKTTLKYNEAIIKIMMPKISISENCISAFCKLGYRKALTVSRIGLAMMSKLNKNGIIEYIKIYAGSVSPVPVRVEKAERLLTGKKLSQETAYLLGKILSELITEITPEEFDRDYKARAVYGVAEDLIKIMLP
jgi:carbon-monoxide dehydrogenase medium subunit